MGGRRLALPRPGGNTIHPMFTPDKWKAGLKQALYLLTTQDLKSPQSASRLAKAPRRGQPPLTRTLEDVSPEELTTGELQILNRLQRAQPLTHTLILDHGPRTLSSSPPGEAYDLIYLPQVQLASLPTVGGRIEFLQSLRDKLKPRGGLLVTPAIGSIRPFSREAVGSALLKIKWRKFPGAWSEGDTLRPIAASGRPRKPLRYFHYYQSEIDFKTELQLAGWRIEAHKRGSYLCHDEAHTHL